MHALGCGGDDCGAPPPPLPPLFAADDTCCDMVARDGTNRDGIDDEENDADVSAPLVPPDTLGPAKLDMVFC